MNIFLCLRFLSLKVNIGFCAILFRLFIHDYQLLHSLKFPNKYTKHRVTLKKRTQEKKNTLKDLK